MTIEYGIPAEEDILDVIWEVFEQRTGKPFVIDDQAGARPETGIYFTIGLTTGLVQEGYDDEILTNSGADLKLKTIGQREMTLSVNAYRTGAKSAMNKLHMLLNTKTMKREIRAAAKAKGFGLAIIEALSSQDLSSIVQSDYEERSQMDVRMRTTSSITETIDPIETVQYESDVSNPAGTKVEGSTNTVTIP